jgi:hypothetical protein
MRALSYAPAGVGRQLGSLSRLRMGAQNARIWTASALIQPRPMSTQNGGTARCYQAIFVPSTALASPGYDGQPAVYLYIAALEVNVLNCRCGGGFRG